MTVVIALAVVATLLVVGSKPVAAAWPETPPGVPAGNVRIPHQMHFITRTVQLGTDGQGRPTGACFDEIYVTFDARYGNPTSSGNHSVYSVHRDEDGTTTRTVVYTTDNVFPINWPAGYALPNPWFTADHHDQLVYRPFTAYGGVSNSQSGILVDSGNPLTDSWCSPSKRDPLVAAMHASAEQLELWTTRPVDPPVDVMLSIPEGPFEVGDEIPVTWRVKNLSEHPATSISFTPSGGLSYSTSAIELLSSSGPPLPTSLEPGEEVVRNYVVKTLAQATSRLSVEVRSTVDGATFNDRAEVSVSVPPDIEVVLDTDVTTETKVGDEFEVIATITNNDEVDLIQIDSEALSTSPRGPVKWVAGPLTADGRDPDSSPTVDLAPGQSTTLHWKYLAEEPGVVDLTAFIRGVDTTLWTTFTVSAKTRVAIESMELVIEDLRLQPGNIVPGQFGTVRGTVRNAGTVDVTDIDFTLESDPELVIHEQRLSELDPRVSPRIARLEPDETREFLIPIVMVIDSGDRSRYRMDLTMTGTAFIGGEFVDVSGMATDGNDLDLSYYWSTILGQVRANLLSDTIELLDGINEWGESSTLGGVAVGSTSGALQAFKKMGDGLIGAGEFLVEETSSGGVRLSETSKAIVEATREYIHTHEYKDMARDLRDAGIAVSNAAVGTVAEWMRDVDRAASRGDVQEVARLFSEPGTEIAVGLGVEKAAAKIFAHAVETAAARKVASYFKRAPDPVDEDWIWLEPEYSPEQLARRELQDLKDMPTGVAISGETVARSGLTADEHGWMIEMAKRFGIAFFVRPRPEIAAKFAKLGYNAKPMAIKLKSINEIDHKWLGWDDYADSEGLVVFREPKDPLQAMMDAVDRGELEWGGPEIDKIIERYNLRRAEWKSFEKPFGADVDITVDPREGILMKLNGDTLGADGTINPGEGFTIRRYGKTIRTKVTIDPDGVIRFTHNNQPVYSDIDLLAIAKPDGTHISPELHKQIAEACGFGIDSQHGDSVLTSDFKDWEQATEFAVKYAKEHMRGHDPLVIVQPDVTTLGYVDTVTVPEGEFPGSNYDLYGLLTTTYEGAGRQ